jgi:hypothetical protein
MDLAGIIIKAIREARRDSKRRQRQYERLQKSRQQKLEREYEREFKEYEREFKQHLKIQELKQIAHEVEAYENHIKQLKSLHKKVHQGYDWQALYSCPEPIKPDMRAIHELAAINKLHTYTAGLFDKLLRREESKRKLLIKAVEEARQKDREDYQTLLRAFEIEYSQWKKNRELAAGVLAGDNEAYMKAIRKVVLLDDIKALGSYFEFRTKGEIIEVEIHINSKKVIPTEVKGLLKSGKLSIKAMKKEEYNKLYKDYVCSCILRIAREIFSFLPVNLILITAVDEIFFPETMNSAEQSIACVVIHRHSFERLNLEQISPSFAMSNFICRMNFSKTKGFVAIERIPKAELEAIILRLNTKYGIA